MTKRVVFITSLIALPFIAGCTAVKPEPVGQPPQLSAKAEAGVEPNEVEPSETEPAKVEPDEIEPAKIEPNEVEPSKAEPDKVHPLPRISFHDKCADVLNNFVGKKGMVDYKSLKRKRLLLKKLLDEFRKLDSNEYRSWPKEDKIAFWVNVYNIQMLNIIVENYPIQSTTMLRLLWGPNSIRHIDRDIAGIWKSKFIVMDEEFTLSEIERRFFRNKFDEPRVFFAASLASLSSPPLRNQPYYGYELYRQLDDQVKRFLSSPGAYRIDKETKTVYLSAILKHTWQGQYFINKYGTDKKFKDREPATRAVLNFLTDYISNQDVSFLELENYSVKFIRYDWTLNDGSWSMKYESAEGGNNEL